MKKAQILLGLCGFLSLAIFFFLQGDLSLAGNLESKGHIPLSQATQPPAPLPLPDWPLVFSDDFSNPASGWYTRTSSEVEVGYVDGLYHIALFNPSQDLAMRAYSRRQHSDFVVEVDVQPLKVPEKVLYGLLARYRDKDNFYCFNARNDGYFKIQIKEAGKWSNLVDWQPSSCIYQGLQGNHLAVVAEGDTLSFYANGCHLTTISDSRFAEGDIGFIAGTAGVAGEVDVFFDNLGVYSEEPPPPVFFGPFTFAYGKTEDNHPIDPATSFPEGVEEVFTFSEYSGMFPEYIWQQELWRDGKLTDQEGPIPWLEEMRKFNLLAFGIHSTRIHMLEEAPLPPGNYEVRRYVNDELVQTGTFVIGEAKAIPQPSTPPVIIAIPTSPVASPPPLLIQSPTPVPPEASPAPIIHIFPPSPTAIPPHPTLIILTPIVIPQEGTPSVPEADLLSRAEELRAQGNCQEAIPLYQKALAETPDLVDAWYGLGRCYYDLDDFEQAVEAFRKAIAARPQNRAAYEYLGRALYFENFDLEDEHRFDEAIAALNKAMELDPQDPDPYDYLGRVYYHLERDDEAIPYLERAMVLDPELADPYYFRGRIHYRREEYAQAIPLFQKCIEVGGEEHVLAADAYDDWGRSYYWLEEYENAIEPLQKSIALEPDRASTHDYLGRAYYKLERYDEAIPYLERAMVLDPELADPYYFRGRIHYRREEYAQAIPLFQKCIEVGGEEHVLAADAYEYWGRSYYWLDDYENAIGPLQKSIAIEPDRAPPHDFLGRVYYRLERYDEAIPYLERAMVLNPELADTYYFRARIHYKREEYAQAIPLFQKCIEVGGEGYGLADEAYEYWGRSYYWLDDYENAIEPLRRSIALEPDSAIPHDFLGRVYYKLDRYDEAIPYMERAMVLDPELPDPYYFRARIHYEREEYTQAIPLFQKCAGIEEDNSLVPWAYTYLGWCYYRLERYQEAESALLEAIARDQTIANAYGGLGWVYYRMGRCPEAVPSFRKAIELDPGFQGWKDGLAECGG